VATSGDVRKEERLNQKRGKGKGEEKKREEREKTRRSD